MKSAVSELSGTAGFLSELGSVGDIPVKEDDLSSVIDVCGDDHSV